MAQFDVYRLATGEHVLDCQSDMLGGYNTHLVVPLLPPSDDLPAMSRLNPVFQVSGEPLVMMTEFAAAVPVRELRQRMGSLADEDLTIKGAFDYLIGGH